MPIVMICYMAPNLLFVFPTSQQHNLGHSSVLLTSTLDLHTQHLANRSKYCPLTHCHMGFEDSQTLSCTVIYNLGISKAFSECSIESVTGPWPSRSDRVDEAGGSRRIFMALWWFTPVLLNAKAPRTSESSLADTGKSGMYLFCNHVKRERVHRTSCSTGMYVAHLASVN